MFKVINLPVMIQKSEMDTRRRIISLRTTAEVGKQNGFKLVHTRRHRLIVRIKSPLHPLLVLSSVKWKPKKLGKRLRRVQALKIKSTATVLVKIGKVGNRLQDDP